MPFKQGEMLLFKARIEAAAARREGLTAQNMLDEWNRVEPTYGESDFVEVAGELDEIASEVQEAIDG